MARDLRFKSVGAPALVELFDIAIDLQPRLDFGNGGLGDRVLFGARSGTFEGPRLSGRVLPGGGDWALFRPDGVMSLDVRLGLETDDGALVHMTYGGRWRVPPELRPAIRSPDRHRVPPDAYYFRTTPVFETGAPEYAWLNDLVCVGTGYLIDGGVAYKIFQLL